MRTLNDIGVQTFNLCVWSYYNGRTATKGDRVSCNIRLRAENPPIETA